MLRKEISKFTEWERRGLRQESSDLKCGTISGRERKTLRVRWRRRRSGVEHCPWVKVYRV